MGARTSGREAALQMIFAMDATGEDAETVIRKYWRSFDGHPETRDYAERCARGTGTALEDIDARIREASHHWRLERMTPVDRNILRLGTYELLKETAVPRAVVLDEAVELAKLFGSEESGSFVNGVLDRVADLSGRRSKLAGRRGGSLVELAFLPPLLRHLDEASSEVLACSVFEDDRPPGGTAGLVNWRLAGRLERLMESEFLTGRRGEILLLPGRPRLVADKILVLGLGPRPLFDEEAFDAAVSLLLDRLVGLGTRSAIVELPGRQAGCLPAEEAADRFLSAVTARDGSFDGFTLIERPEDQRRVTQHMIEARRRLRRL